jgi:hypothetical protein
MIHHLLKTCDKTLATLVLAMIFSAGCKEGGFSSNPGTKGSGSASEVSGEVPSENIPKNQPRPRDEGEGVPGFELVPSRISFNIDGSDVVVNGNAGAVIDESNSVADLILQVWLVDAPRYNTSRALPLAGQIVTLQPNADGSFKATFQTSENFHVSVTVASEGAPRLDRSVFPQNRTVAAIAFAPKLEQPVALPFVAKGSEETVLPLFRFYDGKDHSYQITPKKIANANLELIAFAAFAEDGTERVALVNCADKNSGESTVGVAANCKPDDNQTALAGFLDKSASAATQPVFFCILTSGTVVTDRFVTTNRTECDNAGYQSVEIIGWAL